MKVQVVIHKAEEGGFWAEAPALGRVTEGDTREELLANLHEAVEGVLLGLKAKPAPPTKAAWSKRWICESRLRQDSLQNPGAERLDSHPNQRQSLHL